MRETVDTRRISLKAFLESLLLLGLAIYLVWFIRFLINARIELSCVWINANSVLSENQINLKSD